MCKYVSVILLIACKFLVMKAGHTVVCYQSWDFARKIENVYVIYSIILSLGPIWSDEKVFFKT
jgi:hypothetical protein